MLEITTRQFRLEEDEQYIIINLIKNMPGYMIGTLREYNGDFRADFAVKVI